jgi:hypothetical protein
MMTHVRDIMQHSREGVNDGYVKEGFYRNGGCNPHS